MNIVKLPGSKLSDDTKLIRLVDKKGMQCSVGNDRQGRKFFTFPMRLLNGCRDCGGAAQDLNEGIPRIDLISGKQASFHAVNPVLLSSWSICNSNNPWSDPVLSKSQFASRAYALETSVGQLKKQVEMIIKDINGRCYDEHGKLLMNVIYGEVTYYREMSLQEWEEKTKKVKTGDWPIILATFHKKDDRIIYCYERECRVAFILNRRDLHINNKRVRFDELVKKLEYYPCSIADISAHYISKIHVKNNNDCFVLPINKLDMPYISA